MAIVLPVRQHTQEWLDARENGIGASQAAAAIGLDPWQSTIGLWAEKLRLVPPAAENLAMRTGTALEPLIAQLYTEATGVKVRRANNLRQHPEHAFMLASLDRRAGRKPIELKYSARATGYGEPGTDEVPDHVLIQVLHQLAVLDEEEADVALLKAGANEVAIYPIRRSAEFEVAMVEREASFWDHVQSRTEPPVDGSEATRQTLNALYERVEDNVLDADDGLAHRMARLRLLREDIDAREAERAVVEAEIKAAMLAAKATVVRAPQIGEIPWRQPKDSQVIAWQSLANGLRGVIEALPDLDGSLERALSDGFGTSSLADIEALFTTTRENKPRFGPPKWTDEEETDV